MTYVLLADVDQVAGISQLPIAEQKECSMLKETHELNAAERATLKCTATRRHLRDATCAGWSGGVGGGMVGNRAHTTHSVSL